MNELEANAMSYRSLHVPHHQEQPEKMWLIVCLTPLHSENEGSEEFWSDGKNIPAPYRPSWIHGGEELAIKECLRLAAKTGHQFVIFESVAYTDSVSLSGVCNLKETVHRLNEMPTKPRPMTMPRVRRARSKP